MFFCYSIYYDSWLYCHPLIVVVLLVVVVVEVAVTVLPLEGLTWMRGWCRSAKTWSDDGTSVKGASKESCASIFLFFSFFSPRATQILSYVTSRGAFKATERHACVPRRRSWHIREHSSRVQESTETCMRCLCFCVSHRASELKLLLPQPTANWIRRGAVSIRGKWKQQAIGCCDILPNSLWLCFWTVACECILSVKWFQREAEWVDWLGDYRKAAVIYSNDTFNPDGVWIYEVPDSNKG